jgi:predicted DsbA family dithiol-disulfide isomerase
MGAAAAIYFFDLADPLSYLTELELAAAESDAHEKVERVPLELRPPPLALLDPAGPEWLPRMREAVEVARDLGVELRPPALLPWTRKAHELVLHARARGVERAVLLDLYRALLAEGRDIGRVDVLVGLAAQHALDRTEAKAVLDVDRYSEEVAAGHDRASGLGVAGPPAIVAAAGRLEGFHNRRAIRTFLLSSATEAR